MEKYIEKLSVQVKINNFIHEKSLRYPFKSKSKQKYSSSVGSKELVYEKIHTGMFNKFGITPNDYNSFLEICSNPNNNSLFLLKNNKKIKGYGISLHQEKGGYSLNPQISEFIKRYSYKDFDVIYDDIKMLKNIKLVDLIVGDCFINHNKKRTNDNILLQSKFLEIAFKKLKKGGDMVFLLPFRYDVVFLLNEIYLLEKYFKKVEQHKKKGTVSDLAVVYLYCSNFNKNIDYDLFDKFLNNKLLFDKKFVKSKLKDINEIYMVMNCGLLEGFK